MHQKKFLELFLSDTPLALLRCYGSLAALSGDPVNYSHSSDSQSRYFAPPAYDTVARTCKRLITGCREVSVQTLPITAAKDPHLVFVDYSRESCGWKRKKRITVKEWTEVGNVEGKKEDGNRSGPAPKKGYPHSSRGDR